MGVLLEINTETLSVTEGAAVVAFMGAMFGAEAMGNVLSSAADQLTGSLPGLPSPKTPASMAETLMAAESARVAGLAPAPVGAPAGVVPLAPSGAAGASPAISSPQSGSVTIAPAPANGLPPGYSGPWPFKLPSGVEVDSEGLPWDKRIHSSAKGTLKGGQWKTARNVPAELIASVKAELTAAMGAAPAVPMGAATAPVAGSLAPTPPANLAPNPPAGLTPMAGAVAAGIAPVATGEAPNPPAVDGVKTFADLMDKVVDLQISGVDNALVLQACNAVGLGHPREAHVRPDLIPNLYARLLALG